MANAQQCGVTLQTLDEESFDNGTILAQTPPHGLAIPFKDKCTYPELLSYITPIAANMLVQGLRDRVFVPPLTDVGWLKEMQKKKETEKTKLTKIIHAPKITSADKWINWTEESAIPIERRYRALGRLWSEVQIDTQTKKRIVFEDMELVPTPEAVLQLLKRARRIRTGIVKVGDERKRNVRFMVTCSGKSKEDLKPRFFVVDGDAIIVVSRHGSLRVKRITVEGKGKQDARAVFEGLREWDLWNVQMENFRMIVRDKGGRSSMTDKGWSDKSVWEDVITKSEGAAEEERDQASDETQGVNVRYHPFN
jgi:methionyl-tRNA formyltransferase